ncbi:hypothetical protein MicloDRAFT_00031740 [Microvirga lotononidis]|uniref:Micrococcal nuclease-like nuclease n=1 Tax=Microvirga lotononidis TaxID=864069 RepID=I4YRN3_9HYPH|nr:hypothetical protein MicloDRAFT_00031740 [Microvirga lotononidis]
MRTMDTHAALILSLSLCLPLVPLARTHAETIDGRRVVIIDGDTIALGRERVRLLNVDTPEGAVT